MNEAHPWNSNSPSSAVECFTNSLGMKFVPVPGIEAWFGVWQTRVLDYTAFADQAEPGLNMAWRYVEWLGYKQGPDHPVLKVSWRDAKSFCAWLSRKENMTYRLPTDHEWSVAVGLGHLEDPAASPEEKSGVVAGYPWGSQWPPPPGAGNYRGEECRRAFGWQDVIDGYRDAFPFTAPVGSFPPEHHGIKDLGGNVWEACEDWYSPAKQGRVYRGASWDRGSEPALRSSYRHSFDPARQSDLNGFRCVVLPVGVRSATGS